MRYSIKQTSSPYDVVTLTEAKEILEINTSETRHDTKISIFISAAIADAEKYTGIYFAQRNITLYFDYLDAYCRLPIGPIVSITSLKYKDQNDVLQTMVSGTDYEYDLDDTPPLIKIINYPSHKETLKAFELQIIAGFVSSTSPPSSAGIPEVIRQAILFYVYHQFVSRGEPDKAVSEAFYKTFYNMLMPYRLVRL